MNENNDNDNENNCIICYEKCKKNSVNIDFIINCKCKMNYHKKCIEEWLNIKNKCPICRQIWKSFNDNDNDITKFIICCSMINIFYLIVVIFIV